MALDYIPTYTRKTTDHGKEIFKLFEKFEPEQIIGAYTARYPDSYRFTRQWEGGYVDNPDDPGGCTNKGITIGTLEAWRGEPVSCQDVRDLTDEEAGLIYATNYWAPVKGNELVLGLNTCVWDWGVNSGPSRAIRYLQQMVGASQDGVMGPMTLQAAEDYVASVGIDAAINTYTELRQGYYESLSTFSSFGRGWTNRNNACRDAAMEIAELGPNDPPLQLPTGEGALERLDDLEGRVEDLEDWRRS